MMMSFAQKLEEGKEKLEILQRRAGYMTVAVVVGRRGDMINLM